MLTRLSTPCNTGLVNVKPPPRATSFGDLIRRIRTGRKLGLNAVAHTSGIDPALLSKIETGKRLPPDLPGLLRLADTLGIPEDSDQFAEILAAADRARNLALHEMASKMRGGRPWNPFSADLMNEQPPVFCNTRAELISRATEHAITTNAISITMKSESGTIQKFQVLHERSSQARKRRKR